MDVVRASQLINGILAQLEASTGQLVEEITLDRIDATCLPDDEQVFICSVTIELKRLPGHQWMTEK